MKRGRDKNSRDQEKKAHTWPETSGLTDNESDVLRAFFHLTSKIESSSENKIRIGLSYLDFGVESFDIHLCSRQRLLSCRHPLSQLGEFYQVHTLVDPNPEYPWC